MLKSLKSEGLYYMANIRAPKTIHWTSHARYKMNFYRLSEQKVRSVIHSPKRVEEGIAPDTVAFLQSSGRQKHPHEIWVMAADDGNKRRIISAWRYPGITTPGKPLPAEILLEIKNAV